MESYLGKIFDQNKNKAGSPGDGANSSMSVHAKQLEKMQPFTVDKRDMSYKSKVVRDPMEPTKAQKLSPIPGTYSTDKPKRDLTQSKNY